MLWKCWSMMGCNFFCLYLIFRTAPSAKHVLNTGIPGTCRRFVVAASLFQYFYVSPWEIPWVLQSKGAHLVHLDLPCAGSSKARFCFFQRNNNFPCQLSFEIFFIHVFRSDNQSGDLCTWAWYENLLGEFVSATTDEYHVNHFHLHFEKSAFQQRDLTVPAKPPTRSSLGARL